jgi:hypothetical protein
MIISNQIKKVRFRIKQKMRTTLIKINPQIMIGITITIIKKNVLMKMIIIPVIIITIIMVIIITITTTKIMKMNTRRSRKPRRKWNRKTRLPL